MMTELMLVEGVSDVQLISYYLQNVYGWKCEKNNNIGIVSLDALKDIPEEKELIQEVIQFIDSLKEQVVPGLNQINKANKATVGTFFSVRNPKNAMRSFGTFISKIDWSKSESLNNLFLPFMYLGEEKA